VRLHGPCALVTGSLQLRLQREPGSEPIDARSLASQLWVHEGAPVPCWRLALFQSTRLPA
jgi:hypothetical protein